MKSRPRAVAVLCFLLSSALLAQQQEAAPGNQMTGRVIMEDGSPVPPSAQVELACHGQIRKRVRSYTNGDFRVSLATDNSETPDIAVGGDLFGAKIPFDPRSPTKPAGGGDVGRFDASGCELRAVLPGYQSNVIAVGPRRAMESSEVGRLVLRPMVAPDGAADIPSTLAAPAKSRKAYQSAWMYLLKERPDYASAARQLEKAVVEYSGFAAAWNLMGRTRFALQDAAGARDAFRRSILADPKYADPYIQLARLEMQSGDWEETIRWASQARQLAPHDPDANYLSAFANFQLGQFDAAETPALEVQRSSALDRFPVTYYILASIDARHGDFDSAAAKLQRFLETKPDIQTADSVRSILAEWALDEGARKAR